MLNLFLLMFCCAIYGSTTTMTTLPSTSTTTPISPSRKQKDPTPFSTPQRKTIISAVKPSPARIGKKIFGPSQVITDLNQMKNIDVNCRRFLSELLQNQGRPFVLIRSAVEYQSATALVGPIGIGQIKHIILTPTHPSDYSALSKIFSKYRRKTESDHEKLFLVRDYGDSSDFTNKINKLYEFYNKLNDPLDPIFYKGNYSEDFNSSINFTIFGVFDNAEIIIGDIWLSTVDVTDVVCLMGTCERSTIVDPFFQSMGIGQAAVSMFNEILLENWQSKNITFINESTENLTPSSIAFDGITAYVAPENYKSIGNNFRSGNFLVGALKIENEEGSSKPAKEFLIFRQPSKTCSPAHLAIDSLNQGGRKKDKLLNLWEEVKNLYPSIKAVDNNIWAKNTNEVFEPNIELYQASLKNIKEIIAKGKFIPLNSLNEIERDPSYQRLLKKLPPLTQIPSSLVLDEASSTHIHQPLQVLDSIPSPGAQKVQQAETLIRAESEGKEIRES